MGWAQCQPCGFVTLSHGVGPRPVLQLVSLPWASAGPRLQRVTVTGWWQRVQRGHGVWSAGAWRCLLWAPAPSV